MMDFFKVTLVCLRQSTRAIYGLTRYSYVVFRSKRVWIVVFDVEHEEYLEAVDLTSYVGPYPLGLPLTSLRDIPPLFVYFQVNNGVLYVLDYVEDIYIRVLSFLVSILNPNHMYLQLLLTVLY